MARAVLETDRLTLREITPDDLPFLHRIFGDAECMHYYPRVKSFDETARWFQWLAFDRYASHGFGLWAVTDRQNGALLGDCGITLQETSRGLEPEIGYHLWRDHWGKGYAVEAAAACRNHAIDSLGLARIVSIVRVDNIPSQRVAERVHRRRERFAKSEVPMAAWRNFSSTSPRTRAEGPTRITGARRREGRTVSYAARLVAPRPRTHQWRSPRRGRQPV